MWPIVLISLSLLQKNCHVFLLNPPPFLDVITVWLEPIILPATIYLLNWIIIHFWLFFIRWPNFKFRIELFRSSVTSFLFWDSFFYFLLDSPLALYMLENRFNSIQLNYIIARFEYIWNTENASQTMNDCLNQIFRVVIFDRLWCACWCILFCFNV